MSGFGSLEIGKKALLAQRFGLDVTSNNIANVNTPGYSRRSTVIGEDFSIRKNGFFMGNSVVVQKIQSYRSEYYDKEIRSVTSQKSTYDVDSQFLKRVETTLGEPSNDDVDTMITDFFKSFDQAALNPESVSFRSYIIDKGVALSDRFNNVSSSFDDLRRETITSVNTSVKTFNALLKDISDLNAGASSNTNRNGETSQQFIDERETKLQELSKFADIKVAKNEDNTVNIFINGINIVSGVHYSTIDYRINSDTATSEKTIELFKKDSETGVETNIQPQAGELFANVRMHNELLDPVDSSGNFSIAKQFNDFVTTFANKVNGIMSTGYGMNDTDTTAPSPARFFFNPAPPDTISAGTIYVNPDLISNPKNLPLSSKANEPGNTDIARSVANLADDKNFLENLSPIEYYSSFIAKVGNKAKEAVQGLGNTKLVEQQLDTQRESQMGVNLDEEAVNLIKYQKGFEAASRIINLTNELLDTLINLGR